MDMEGGRDEKLAVLDRQPQGKLSIQLMNEQSEEKENITPDKMIR